jgi:hypothetical protein
MSETLLIYNGRAINELGKLGLRFGLRCETHDGSDDKADQPRPQST